MKILIIHGGEITLPGGVYMTVRETAKHLADRGHEIILLQDNPLSLPKEEFYNGFKVIRVKSRFFSFYGFNLEIYLYLKKHFKELNPDIVHIHGYHYLLTPEVIYLIKKLCYNIPIVFSPHFGIDSRSTFGGKYLWGLYNKLIGKKIMRSSDIIVTASEFEADNLIKIFKVSSQKLKVISHGVNLINTKYLKNKGKKINLLYVGYLLELKGVQYIIEVVHELVYKKKVNVCLNIVGEGPYEEKLKNLANKLNVNKYIKWERFVHSSESEKLLDFYKKSNILLLLSKSENYGIVVSEALSMGTPVIVTKRTALNEFLKEPGCFGVNYPPNKTEVADLILDIYKKKIKIGPFSKKIRTWNKVAISYEQLYFDLLNKKS